MIRLWFLHRRFIDLREIPLGGTGYWNRVDTMCTSYLRADGAPTKLVSFHEENSSFKWHLNVVQKRKNPRSEGIISLLSGYYASHINTLFFAVATFRICITKKRPETVEFLHLFCNFAADFHDSHLNR